MMTKKLEAKRILTNFSLRLIQLEAKSATGKQPPENTGILEKLQGLITIICQPDWVGEGE